jgi:hypothetical protein
MKDPIVQEVRRIREKLAGECDFDLHKIAIRQKRLAARWKGKKVNYVDLTAARQPIRRVAESMSEYGKK